MDDGFSVVKDTFMNFFRRIEYSKAMMKMDVNLMSVGWPEKVKEKDL